ncbi:hypothetical protein KAJ87_01085 [Candidatus Pacearchaeota archaeon]|nr:hypothetical protein [Candidatus Pacearchaeota archaeon]
MGYLWASRILWIGFFGDENHKSKIKEIVNKKLLTNSDLENNLNFDVGGGIWFSILNNLKDGFSTSGLRLENSEIKYKPDIKEIYNCLLNKVYDKKEIGFKPEFEEDVKSNYGFKFSI